MRPYSVDVLLRSEEKIKYILLLMLKNYLFSNNVTKYV
jgi:hypothetical protein